MLEVTKADSWRAGAGVDSILAHGDFPQGVELTRIVRCPIIRLS